jgi:hypothetical protein
VDRNTEVAEKKEITPPPLPPVATINRSYSVQKDPPATVLRFVNKETNEIEEQIPSEVSLRVYKNMVKWLEQNK